MNNPDHEAEHLAPLEAEAVPESNARFRCPIADNGHIEVGVNNPEHAAEYLAPIGAKVVPRSIAETGSFRLK